MSLRRSKYIFAIVLLSATSIVMPSCHSSKGTTAQRVNNQTNEQPSKKTQKPDTPAANSKVARQLVETARRWIGTPYVYGGHSRKGTDCSGFLMEVFSECVGVKLPRSAREQKEYCHPIDREYLAVGDLVFFSSKRSGGRISHVGMYIGNGRMIHASSSRGVVEDDLSMQYFVTHYRGAGRVPSLASVHPLPTNRAEDKTQQQQTPENKPTKTAAPKPAAEVSTSAAKPDTTATQRPESIVRNAFSKTKK